MRPVLEVADILRRHGGAFRAAQGPRLSSDQRRAMAAIEACRTATLGGHVERCDDCGLVRVAYNSCRDRHCPKCQALARAQWLAERQVDLLPVPYFHVVFTVPAPVAAIALQNKAVIYDILLKAAAETIRLISADPKHLGAETGMIAILHTWGQTLTHHPHAHCLVPGGGIAPDGSWVHCRPGFFLPVRVLSRLYRRLFLERLQAAFVGTKLQFFGHLAHLVEPAAFASHLNALRKVEWVVYAKRPFGGPEQVLAYLGRYTHRVAIANGRLLTCDQGHVRFRWKDYRAGNKSKVMTLDTEEFLRRFLLHILPKGFRRIRHFGFLANACRAAKLARIRAALDAPQPPPPAEAVNYRERCAILLGHRLDLCPICGGRMVEIGLVPRAPAQRRAAPRCDTS
ncbi:transposase [Bradyrhizobium sp. CCBAU 11386]|uniref:IS91 family transposase n=1 Tax=Bradyrhizobium sp. CCBAU 11386 TaxID=1630837 RepID=UPI002302699E|nr:IS91 family transposase [Bradyrhizobium sp. CCBAU 11386]MDA9503892.1 transposase [Bradyrhizobium sp. CCBAU 11386]